MNRRQLLFKSQVLIAIWLFSLLLIKAQTAPTSLIPGDIDADAFPDVQMGFRVVDSVGAAVSGITVDQINLTEDGIAIPKANIQLHSSNTSPINVIFVLDEGQYPIYGGLQSNIHAIIRGLTPYFQDGVDRVAILHGSSRGVVETLSLTSSASAFRNTAGITLASSRSSGRSDTLRTLQAALDLIDDHQLAASGPTMVVFIARRIDSGSFTTQQIIDTANQSNVPIFVLHATMIESGDSHDTMRRLASDTGGGYWRVERSATVAAIENHYRNFDNQRTRYEMVFTSTNPSNSQRQVQLEIGDARTQLAYDLPMPITPPTVSINDPAPNQVIDRQPIIDEEAAEMNFAMDHYTVTATYSSHDSYERPIQSARLYVDNAMVDEINQPTGSTFNFIWDIVSIRKDGSNPRNLLVEVTDSMGLVAKSETVTVTVPITVPEEVIVVIEEDVFVETYCQQDPNSWNCRFELLRTYVPLVALALTVFTTFYFRRQLRHIAVEGASVVANLATDVRKTILGSQIAGGQEDSDVHAWGRVEVIEGPEAFINGQSIGRSFDIYHRRNQIGRDPSKVNIQFYSMTDETTVSGHHCDLNYDSTNQIFKIVDKSSAGTRVNGRRITSDEPMSINSTDDIVLGSPGKNHLKLRIHAYQSADLSVVPELNKNNGKHEFAPTKTQLGDEYPAGEILATEVYDDVDDVPSTEVSRNKHPRKRDSVGRKNKDWLSDL